MEQKVKIWVIWSSYGDLCNNDNRVKSGQIWEWIAKTWCSIVTWSSHGLAYDATIWTKKYWGFAIWVSPAFSEKEHAELYWLPTDVFDLMLFTWRWIIGKAIVSTRASDAVIMIWWSMWTLNEFTISYDEGKIIWILTGTWGVADNIPLLLKYCNRDITERMFFSSDPRELVERIVIAIKELPKVIYEDERVKMGKWH